MIVAAHASVLANTAGPGEARAAIHVTVADHEGLPVTGALVRLAGQTVAFHRIAESDIRGQATFTDLPEGTFVVSAVKSGFITQAFGQHGAGEAVPIALAADGTFHARIGLTRTGSLSGVVTDEDGRPAWAHVQAYRRERHGNEQTLMSAAATQASAKGIYQIDGLPPAEYIVSARGSGGGGDRAAVFHPGTMDPFDALTVSVRSGAVTYGVDLRLQAVAPARIEGVVLDAHGQPSAGVRVQLARTRAALEQITAVVRSDEAGAFRRDVPPGAYRIRTDTGGVSELTAAAGAVTPVTVTAPPPATLSGRIELAGVVPAGRLTAGTVVAELIANQGDSAVPLRMLSGDRRRLRPIEIAPGEYSVRLAGSLPGWSLESIAVGQRLAADDRVRVTPDERIDDLIITLTDRPSTLSGRVVDQSGAPRFDRRILVFAATSEWWVPGSRRVMWAQPDTDGQFVAAGLPAGDYLIAAIADAGDMKWDRALLESAAPGAIAVSLARGATVVQHVMIAR